MKKNEKENYTFVKNKIFVRSKLDKRPKEEQDNSILHISSLTGDGIIKLMKKIEKIVVNIGAAKDILTTVAKGNFLKAIKIAIIAINPAIHLRECNPGLFVL